MTKKFLIKVTNRLGESLYAANPRRRNSKLGFRVITKEKAQQYSSASQANAAIKSFTGIAGTTFEVEEQ